MRQVQGVISQSYTIPFILVFSFFEVFCGILDIFGNLIFPMWVLAVFEQFLYQIIDNHVTNSDIDVAKSKRHLIIVKTIDLDGICYFLYCARARITAVGHDLDGQIISKIQLNFNPIIETMQIIDY